MSFRCTCFSWIHKANPHWDSTRDCEVHIWNTPNIHASVTLKGHTQFAPICGDNGDTQFVPILCPRKCLTIMKELLKRSALEEAERHHGARGVHSVLEFWELNDPQLVIQQSRIDYQWERKNLFAQSVLKDTSFKVYAKQNICVHQQWHS